VAKYFSRGIPTVSGITIMNKPFAESSEQNKQVILQVLQKIFTAPGEVLEIGSGTGQHAVHFTQHLPHVIWQPTDCADQIPGMKLWFNEVAHQRIKQPLVLDVNQTWPNQAFDYVFTANTLHIVSWPAVQAIFAGAGKILKSDGLFAQYGPFNYDGKYTSESNARFDMWLKDRDPQSGIRNFEDLLMLAKIHGMVLHSDHEMPVNNRILVWQKI
jgi:cyclopropane fatty-acyl-phospholipid synthase-like methyltransferase